MSSDPRNWFAIDHDLWQPPGPKKLTWWQRKVAIYLRKCSGVHGDGKDQRPDVVLRSLSRIATDTDLSESKVEKAVQRLRKWPSRRQPFVQQHNNTEVALRPLPRWFVRCPNWLWKSPLPDDLKDVFLFIRSRFTGKTIDGQELFDCNLWGTRQPSIYVLLLGGNGFCEPAPAAQETGIVPG
jgi:hypothetical protein